jgi:protein SCO1/2
MTGAGTSTRQRSRPPVPVSPASMRPLGSWNLLAASVGIGVVVGAIAVVMAWEGDPDELLPNDVQFEISCSDMSQRQFNHATSLLHELRYADSERTYTAIARAEPDCAMAYWGIAMSRLKRPIAAPPAAADIEAARTALRTGSEAHTATKRERAYIAALGPLVEEGALVDWPGRTLTHEKAMEAIAHEYPGDHEASVFYALALNRAASPSDLSKLKQTKATELLLMALSEQPGHPGIEHYLTYCVHNGSAEAGEPTLPQTAVMSSATRRMLLGSLGALLAIGLCSLVIVGPAWAEGAARAIGGPFTLTSGNLERISDREFRGKWLLVYFGYTHSPEICPRALADIAETLKQLGSLAAEVRPIFITIDPERDTPEVTSSFARRFDPRINGLSGTPAEISAVAKEYRVYYKKAPHKDADPEDYPMEHSSFVHVIGPTGAYVTLFSPRHGHGSKQMALRLRQLIMQNSTPTVCTFGHGDIDETIAA